MTLLSDIYDVTLKRGIRGFAKGGLVRPTIGEHFMTHKDFTQVLKGFSGTVSFVHRLREDTLQTKDEFGFSIAYSCGWMAVGAVEKENSGTGSVYMFEDVDGTFIFKQKLTASTATVGAWFGFDVAMDGNRLVVGAVNGKVDISQAHNGGAVYVFERLGSTWSEMQVLIPADYQESMSFGNSVDIYCDTIVCGCPAYYNGGTYEGLFQIFEYNSTSGKWDQNYNFYSKNRVNSQYFGSDVAIHNDRIVISYNAAARNEIEMYKKTGSVWLYDTSLSCTGGSHEVDVYNDTVAVCGYQTGVVEIFKYTDSWNLLKSITTNTNFYSARYHRISMNEFLIAVSFANAPIPGYSSTEVGVIELITNDGNEWSHKQVIYPDSPGIHEECGWSLTIADDYILAGSKHWDATVNTAENSGSVFVFKIQ